MNRSSTPAIAQRSIWAEIWRRPVARGALSVLGVLYGMTLFADVLAPYAPDREERDFSYAPPSVVRFVHEGRLAAPFVYGMTFGFTDLHRRVYREDVSRRYPLKFFVRGDAGRFMGVIPADRHFIGVEEPGRFFLLGADSRGRDIFSRVVHGGRISLTIGLIGVLISFSIGLLVGGASGYFGGRVDDVLMRLCEMVMMVPGFYLLLALRAAVPDTFTSLQVYVSIIVILSFIGWASLARIIRGMCLSLRERDYVHAARSMGVSHLRVILVHILPHTVSYTLAAVMLSVPGYILGESALSLLGLGIQDPYVSWGNMLTEAMSLAKVVFAPWLMWPAAFICVTVAAFNLLGDALRDILDPHEEGVS